jgi:subtilisin family serine protease
MNHRRLAWSAARVRRLDVEPLEPRQLLAGDSPIGLAQLIGLEQIQPAQILPSQIVWQGQTSDVRAGYYNGEYESATPYGTPAIPAALLPVTWSTVSLGEGFFTLFAPDATPDLVEDWATLTPGVLSIEPDFIIDAPPASGAIPSDPGTETSSVPNDPGYPLQWALPIIKAPTAWDVTVGDRPVIVAVLDSGIDLSHPDLIGNTWKNPREIAGNGIDDDGNNFIDDVYGWNFLNDTSDVQDGYGHGTHVSGIIGAVGNNGVGITGLNWQGSLMSLKMLADNGVGTVSTAIAAMNYVTMMRRDFETNIVVANNSWGASTGFSVVMRDAIVAMGDIGIAFVASAGNNASSNDVLPRYPSSYDVPNVISVAASDSNDTLSSFSNYGPTSVDLAAPGSLIYSTLSGGTYGFLSGTSMAAPQVAGAIALLNAGKPGLTVAEARAAILGSTDLIPSMAGQTVTGGRLNIDAAMQSLGLTPVTPPIPPPPTPPTPAPLPFTDSFNQPNSPSLSGFWGTRIGGIGITNQAAESRVSGVAISTLNNVRIVDSASQAFVNLDGGVSAGLVARYTGGGDTRMYLANMVRSASGFTGRIWRNTGTTWKTIASGVVTASSGVLRFEVAGSSLTLLFNGIRVAGAFDTAIPGAGAVGIRFTGRGASIDNYVQSTLTAPIRNNATLPFTDSFNGVDIPYVPASWSKRIGNLATTNNVVVSRFNNVSIMAVNGVSTRDSSAQAFVNIVNGTAVNLVARYTGAGDNRMYAAGLVRSGFNFFGRIWMNTGTRWVILSSSLAPGGSGILRFDVTGSALTLFLNGRQLTAASNKAITGPGALGIRFVGPGSVADTYQAIALTPPTPTPTTSPFVDTFIQADSPFLGSNWVQVYGNTSISNDQVISRIRAPSLATLYGVSVTNSSSQVTVRDATLQAVVNVGSGTSAALAARFRGTVDHCMYAAGLQRVGDAYFGRIWVNSGSRWKVLASVPVPGGSGRIRFDCIGSALSLYLNGVKIAAVRDTTLPGPGAVGLRLTGAGSTVDSYAYERR